jgi:hypothetical protein
MISTAMLTTPIPTAIAKRYRSGSEHGDEHNPSRQHRRAPIPAQIEKRRNTKTTDQIV